MIGDNITLSFSLSVNAKPPIHEENITVTLDGATLETGDRVLLEMDDNELRLTISSLMSADEGVYEVTIETTAGSATARTSLTLYGEGNGLY